MTRHWIWIVAGVGLWFGFGCGDDDGGGESCNRSDAAVSGESCSCGDAGGTGERTCGASGKWSACKCNGAIGEAGSGATAGRSSGQSGSTGSAGRSTGSAGSSAEDEDGGVSPADSGAPMSDAGPATNPDGGQSMQPAGTGERLAKCGTQGDAECGDGLVCYRRSFGPGFCTTTCMNNEGCADLTDAEYTCSTTGGGGMGMGGMTTGMCRVDCDGANDTSSCPGDLVCIAQFGGGPGQGQGGQNTFRCGYPAQTQNPQPGGSGDVALWGRCSSSADCADGMSCYGAFGGGGGGGQGNGFCTTSCESTDDCTMPQSSGDIAPTCGGQNLCRFDCSQGGTCPDGMECTGDRCIYAN